MPLLFTAGRSLFDTRDGAFINLAYGWAFACPPACDEDGGCTRGESSLVEGA